MSLQLKYKKLKYEIKYLELEQSEIEDKFRECMNDFEKAFRDKVGPEYKDPNSDKKIKLKEPIKRKKIKNEEKQNEVKKVYRRIVTKTHPDKLEQLPNNTIKKKLIKHYKDAVNRYDNNDMVGLFDIADELDIKLPEIDESYIDAMESTIESLKIKIKRYKETNAWIWYHSTGEVADNLLTQIIKNL
tara:strand:+ start:2296 stop:2856 length:561 start_codon:yes stop_codon:yes gene_type:complete